MQNKETLSLEDKSVITNAEKVLCELDRVWQNKDSLFNPTLTKAVKDAELSIVNARMLKDE